MYPALLLRRPPCRCIFHAVSTPSFSVLSFFIHLILSHFIHKSTTVNRRSLGLVLVTKQSQELIVCSHCVLMSTDVGNVVSEANEAAAGDGNDGQQDEDSAGIVRTWLRT